jgi:hypothetical protein
MMAMVAPIGMARLSGSASTMTPAGAFASSPAMPAAASPSRPPRLPSHGM